MKKLVVVTVSLFVASGCCSQESQSRAFNDALRNGAKAKYTFRIEDAIGKPISNATVNVGFVMMNNRSQKVVGNTDTNGLFTAEGLTQWEIGVRVSKDGYYDSIWGVFLGRDGQEVADGRWQPWNPTIPIVLREKRNPIPMCVKRFEGRFANGDTVGFDCEKGDFVEPHGNGKVTDFKIRVEGWGTYATRATKEIRLDALDADGGFMVLKKHDYSDYKSEYLAPESGYNSNLTAASSYTRNGGRSGTKLYDGDDERGVFNQGSEYLVFKSRIIRDDDGNVISANYGKIYGDIQYGGSENTKGAHVQFKYYFNPTPNDRNIEFDGENSLLLKGAKFIP